MQDWLKFIWNQDIERVCVMNGLFLEEVKVTHSADLFHRWSGLGDALREKRV